MAFCCAPVQNFYATGTAAVVSSSEFSSFSSVSEAGAYFRECMTKRQEVIKIELPIDKNETFEKVVDQLFAEAIKETGKGCEGDYLRLSVRSYNVSGQSSSTKRRFTFNMLYHSTAEQEAFVDTKVKDILKSLDLGSKSDYQKIDAVYDFVVNCASYAEDLSEPSIFSAYGALANNAVVCQGYSQLLYRLLSDAGISCRTVLGEGRDGSSQGVDHVWNIAELEGAYYLLDPTWDSNLGGTRNYFLRGSGDFDTIKPYSHITSTGESDNPVFSPDYTSAEFKAAYPVSEKAYVPNGDERLGTILGDLNGDGKYSAVDASIVLVNCANHADGEAYSEKFISIADTNGDSRITAVDASYILKYCAALNDGTKLSLEEYVSKEIRRAS
ncbi:MAG: hypothetical protein IKO47_10185 [Ruminococcus sp.]|nr:hypothetical protein [Ruminococcus sp.]